MPRKMHGTDYIQTTEPDLLFRDVGGRRAYGPTSTLGKRVGRNRLIAQADLQNSLQVRAVRRRRNKVIAPEQMR
jgi:hypothetical protein